MSVAGGSRRVMDHEQVLFGIVDDRVESTPLITRCASVPGLATWANTRSMRVAPCSVRFRLATTRGRVASHREPRLDLDVMSCHVSAGSGWDRGDGGTRPRTTTGWRRTGAAGALH